MYKIQNKVQKLYLFLRKAAKFLVDECVGLGRGTKRGAEERESGGMIDAEHLALAEGFFPVVAI